VKHASLVALLVVSLLAAPARAWGPIGHRVAAQIAEHNISGKTRARIVEILGSETLVEASNWPDEQRANPDAYWQKISPAFHLVDVPVGVTTRAMSHPPEGDAVTALADFVATLRDPRASRADKQRALRFVAHIVQDLHQPLHVRRGTDNLGFNFVVSYRSGPQGAVTTNMHLLWDMQMIQGLFVSASEYAAQLEGHITPEQTVAWWTADPLVWIEESVTLLGRIYPATGGPLGSGTANSPAIVPGDYTLRMRPILEERLQQAGIRLAAYLDWIFAGA
jgi:S1/P1 Nuclease